MPIFFACTLEHKVYANYPGAQSRRAIFSRFREMIGEASPGCGSGLERRDGDREASGACSQGSPATSEAALNARALRTRGALSCRVSPASKPIRSAPVALGAENQRARPTGDRKPFPSRAPLGPPGQHLRSNADRLTRSRRVSPRRRAPEYRRGSSCPGRHPAGTPGRPRPPDARPSAAWPRRDHPWPAPPPASDAR